MKSSSVIAIAMPAMRQVHYQTTKHPRSERQYVSTYDNLATRGGPAHLDNAAGFILAAKRLRDPADRKIGRFLQAHSVKSMHEKKLHFPSTKLRPGASAPRECLLRTFNLNRTACRKRCRQ
ncbi:MAG TPA: hypothetical protein VJ828_13690 [Lacipirellulaceae bacterium]|nr:hypothetical protein [Lacipirellulaceae bacterium]